MLLSVIVPVYNSSIYIEKLLNCIFSQSLRDFELIVVDDGSTDNTVELLSRHMERFANFKLIKTKHLGVSHARNAGIKAAIGKYIMFVDSDDFVSEDFFDIMVRTIESNDCQLVECMVDKDKAPRILANKLISKDDAITLFYSYMSDRIIGTVYNKIFIRNRITNFFDESIYIGEDAEFLLNYILNTDSVFRIKNVLYHHTINNNGIIKSSKIDSYLTAQNASVKMLATILECSIGHKELAINDVILVTSKIIKIFPNDKNLIIQNLLQQLTNLNIWGIERIQGGVCKFDCCDYFVTNSLCNPHIHLGEKIIKPTVFNSLEDFLSNNNYDISEKNINKKKNLEKLCNEGTLNYAYDNYDSAYLTKLNTVLLSKTIDADSIKKSDGLFINFLPNIQKETLFNISKILGDKYLFVHISSSKYEDEIERTCFDGSVVETLKRANLLNEKTVIIHGIHFNNYELKCIANSNAWLCICPLNNACINEPVYEINKLLKMGIKVCVGSDSISLTGTNSVLLNCNYLLQNNKASVDSIIQILFRNNQELLYNSCKKNTFYYCLWKSKGGYNAESFINGNKELICVFDENLSVYNTRELLGDN